MKVKKALVLGATGGMGYAVVHELNRRGVEVVAFARGKGQKWRWLIIFTPTVYIQDSVSGKKRPKDRRPKRGDIVWRLKAWQKHRPFLSCSLIFPISTVRMRQTPFYTTRCSV
jgi:nucleoside-diphosphate-sugar epimerase